MVETRANKKSKRIILKKIFFKLIKDTVSGKSMRYVKKDRDIKLVKITARGSYLVSEQIYLTTTFFLKIS